MARVRELVSAQAMAVALDRDAELVLVQVLAADSVAGLIASAAAFPHRPCYSRSSLNIPKKLVRRSGRAPWFSPWWWTKTGRRKGLRSCVLSVSGWIRRRLKRWKNGA